MNQFGSPWYNWAMAWRTLLTYPSYIDSRLVPLLDALAALVPIARTDRYVALADWFRAGRDQGLLTNNEYWTLRSEVAQAI